MSQARVVAGKAKGRVLSVPDGVRPTTALCRKVLMDVLGSHVQDAEVLDLFAGPGVLSAELLSRGARHLTAVERSPRIAAVWERNMTHLGFRSQVCLMVTSARRAISSLRAKGQRFSLIVADPPYGSADADLLWVEAPWEDLLVPGGLLVIEQSARDPRPVPSGLTLVWHRAVGDTSLYLFRRSMECLV